MVNLDDRLVIGKNDIEIENIITQINFRLDKLQEYNCDINNLIGWVHAIRPKPTRPKIFEVETYKTSLESYQNYI